MRHYLIKKRYGCDLLARFLKTFLLCGLAVCVLFLSSCSMPGSTPGGASSSNATKTVPTPTPVPAVTLSLKNEGTTQLLAFESWISLMKQYNGDTTQYQQQYTADQQALQSATTPTTYNAALKTLNTHVDAIKLPAMKAELTGLQQKLQQQVASWGQQHKYYDAYNNTTYSLGYEYSTANNGIGSWSQDDLNSSSNLADYQQAVENINMYETNFQAMMADSGDATPYNRVHATDTQLMQHYGKTSGDVIVVSLAEQAMRIYQDGKLVNAFLVTTGQPDLPTPAGVWWVESKQSPTVFKSDEPVGSPHYYPPTPINFAMQYHSNGYFLHDSWWRNDYGPHTNFPHADSSGDSFSAQGSHGCVNLSKDNAGWLYNFVKLFTPIIIY